MPKCKHCNKFFKAGNGKGSLKTHKAAVKAAKTRGKSPPKTPTKPSSKSSGNFVKAKACPVCKKLFEISKLKKHISYHARAKRASNRNAESEKQYVKKLKKQRPKALLFQTGKEVGVPDIVLYENSKLTFYEIKPTKQENDKNSRLKDTQVAWIKKNCLAKKIEAYIVFYKGPTRKMIFTKKLLTRKNIKKYG